MRIEEYRLRLRPVRRGLFSRPIAPVIGESQLQVNVVFTTASGTATALKAAQKLADGLTTRTLLLVPELVPVQFPLLNPPVSIAFIERRLHAMARDCHAELDIHVRVLLCRDAQQCVLQALPPESLVVVGGRKRWWPAPERKLTRLLRSNGHNVIFVEGD